VRAARSKLDISDIFKLVSVNKFTPDQQKVYRAITRCRTAELGGHIVKCLACGHQEQSYNSCWNRHCPKCQGGAAFKWTADREKELLPVPYFHVVFTIPEELRDLCYYNKLLLYDILFKSSSDTLLDIAKKNHDIKLGFFGVLHTWNQEMQFHPHAHFAVPGGGIDSSGKWKEIRKSGKFLLPVKVLSQVFCGKFIEQLKAAYKSNKLYLEGTLSHLKNPKEFEHLINRATSKSWVVYAKRPFAGPDVVLKYLSNYTHKVAISNYRLRSISDNLVTFSARDLKRKDKKRLVSLPPYIFVQRFLQHTLPFGLRRIRYFGFLHNSQKKVHLEQIRSQLNVTSKINLKASLTPLPCSKCQSNHLIKLPLSHNPHSNNPNQASTHQTAPQNRCLSPPSTA
jgi:hypothetical protein